MDTKELTGVVTFSDYIGRQIGNIGSTMIRAEAVAEIADSFELYIPAKKYDNLIFQKAYWKEMMELFEGPKILDLSDPDWIVGGVNIIEIGNLVHAITCSSPKLTQLLTLYFPDKIVRHIPDRLNFEKLPQPKLKHSGKAKNLLWFGYIHNAHETLIPLLPYIKNKRLNLTIIADRPFKLTDHLNGINYSFKYYDQNTIYSEILNFDILLNPKSERAFFKYKSNNKSIIAGSLGIPVAETVEDIKRLLSAKARNEQSKHELEIITARYNVIQSVEEYQAIFKEIRYKHFS